MNKKEFEESVQACIDQVLVSVNVHDGVTSCYVCAFFEGFNGHNISSIKYFLFKFGINEQKIIF
jgi:hypothetical protein